MTAVTMSLCCCPRFISCFKVLFLRFSYFSFRLGKECLNASLCLTSSSLFLRSVNISSNYWYDWAFWSLDLISSISGLISYYMRVSPEFLSLLMKVSISYFLSPILRTSLSCCIRVISSCLHYSILGLIVLLDMSLKSRKTRSYYSYDWLWMIYE